jgi:hypothetical protein
MEVIGQPYALAAFLPEKGTAVPIAELLHSQTGRFKEENISYLCRDSNSGPSSTT